MALNFAKNNSLSAVTALPASVSGGGLNLISTQTASSSATIDFTSGIDSTYKEYIFKFINIHGATEDAEFNFQGSTDGGSSYGVTITSTAFQANHAEGTSSYFFGYNTGWDLAQSTSFQTLFNNLDADNDECLSGDLHLFNPSDTSFAKHFISRIAGVTSADSAQDDFRGGYFNSTSAIDAIQFKMSSGNIDAGTIKLYGVT